MPKILTYLMNKIQLYALNSEINVYEQNLAILTQKQKQVILDLETEISKN